MNKKIHILIASYLYLSLAYATNHTITTVGNAFSPALLTIELGDTITFNLNSPHTALEVDKTNWEDNNAKSNGGFHQISKSSILVLTDTGMHYYICEPHASIGMKGRIQVNSSSSGTGTSIINSNYFQNIKLYPTYISDVLNLELDLTASADVRVELINIEGKNVFTFIDNKMFLSGLYKNSFNISHKITRGIYFIRTNINGTYQSVQKVVIE